MRLVRLATAETFQHEVGAFLLEHEACHNLLLGIAANLINSGAGNAAGYYFAAVAQGRRVVAAASMTPPHNIVLSHVTEREALRLIAEDLLETDASVPGVHGPIPVSEQFAHLWLEVTGRPYRKVTSQRIYQAERVRPVAGVPGRLRRAGDAERELLVHWMTAFQQEALPHSPVRDEHRAVDAFLHAPGRGLYLWETDRPVSMAGHTGPTPNGIRVSAVYTPPGERNRGYASACVAELTQILLDRGRRFCFLYTDLDNPTSNRIYQRIGYEAVCAVEEYRFEKPSTPRINGHMEVQSGRP